MSQLDNIESAQRSLEESFNRRMAELEAQLNSGGPAKDTVARVAEEFRTFRELIFNMLGLLRRQITECHQLIDTMESRHRRKSLIFMGLPESEGENCSSTILQVVQDRLGVKNISGPDLTICHRIGAPNKDRHRPILVRFSRFDLRTAVWRVKTSLRGSSISIREFLTKARQTVFSKARQYFGMKCCWTQDGVIVVKTPEGSRHKLMSIEELNVLMEKHPRAPNNNKTTATSGTSKNIPQRK